MIINFKSNGASSSAGSTTATTPATSSSAYKIVTSLPSTASEGDMVYLKTGEKGTYQYRMKNVQTPLYTSRWSKSGNSEDAITDFEMTLDPAIDNESKFLGWFADNNGANVYLYLGIKGDQKNEAVLALGYVYEGGHTLWNLTGYRSDSAFSFDVEEDSSEAVEIPDNWTVNITVSSSGTILLDFEGYEVTEIAPTVPSFEGSDGVYEMNNILYCTALGSDDFTLCSIRNQNKIMRVQMGKVWSKVYVDSLDESGNVSDTEMIGQFCPIDTAADSTELPVSAQTYGGTYYVDGVNGWYINAGSSIVIYVPEGDDFSYSVHPNYNVSETGAWENIDGVKLISLSQDEYDALSSYADNTIYNIVEEED